VRFNLTLKKCRRDLTFPEGAHLSSFFRAGGWPAGWLVAAGWLLLRNPDLWLAGCWLAG
jgi:hypothetical protein